MPPTPARAPILRNVKSIGPYVAARELTGQRPLSAVRTLHATDRLTGMPVLLHVLPHPAPLPALPASPFLVPPSDGGISGETAYLLTELPPHARPAGDPLLAAHGGLGALAALHGAGMTHGGVSSAQLWEVDGQVVLVGAGLPWGGEASPTGDLRDLLVALEMLGGVPPALQGVALDGTSARELLGRLAAPPPRPRLQQPAPDVPTAHDGTPIVLGGALSDTLWNAAAVPVQPPTPARPPSEPSLIPDTLMDDSSLLVVTPAAPARRVAAPAAEEARPTPADPEPVRAAEPTVPEPPVSQEAPQVIRAVVDDAALPNEVVSAAEPETVRSAPTPARRLPRDPVRIVWNADGTRRVVKESAAGEGLGAPPAPRRFGPARPLLPLLALLLVLLAGVGAVLAWRARPAPATSPITVTPAAKCCPVTFTVRGAGGVPVRLSVLSFPAGADLRRGQKVGRAPGVVRFPVAGSYTLRVSAQGYSSGTVTVQAPSSVPVQVALTP